jgi:Phosphotransferase enzyme family
MGSGWCYVRAVDAEIELTGGRATAGVARSGVTVRRATGPWTPTVHAYLRHLEERGFVGAPQVLGLDADRREILTFVAGVVPSSSTWTRGRATRLPEPALSDEALVAVARLIRSLHDAAADFRPSQPVWREHAYPLLPGEIVCHGDLGPHNTVYRDGGPVAFIDWDGARPNASRRSSSGTRRGGTCRSQTTPIAPRWGSPARPTGAGGCVCSPTPTASTGRR